MTRLDRSARDYAIACCARGLPPDDTWTMVGLRRDYLQASQEVASLVCLLRRGGGVGASPSISDALQARRLVRARVALYLRMMRRVEAWETWERTGAVSQLRGTGGKRSFRYVDMGDHVALVAFATPWRPLWTSAPPHEPGVTARMRRSAPPQRANE